MFPIRRDDVLTILPIYVCPYLEYVHPILPRPQLVCQRV